MRGSFELTFLRSWRISKALNPDPPPWRPFLALWPAARLLNVEGRMNDAARDMSKAAFPSEPILCAELEVLPEWIDFNNHMNVGYYMLAFENALDPFFTEWFGLNTSFIEEYGMGPFSMQASIHYHSELRVGQRFRVYFQLLDCDAKRWHFLCLMQEAQSGKLSASLEQLGINVDHATRRSAPMPDPLRRRFEQLMDAHRHLPRPDFVGAPLGIRRKG